MLKKNLTAGLVSIFSILAIVLSAGAAQPSNVGQVQSEKTLASVSSLKVVKSGSVKVGDWLPVDINAHYTDGTIKTVSEYATVTEYDPEIATWTSVGSFGQVDGHSPGRASFKASYGGKTVRFSVNVVE